MTNPSNSTALANETSLSSSPTKNIPNSDDNHLSEKKPTSSDNSDQPLPPGKEEIDNMHRNNNSNVQSFNMEDFPPGFGTSYSVNHSELTPVHTDLEAPGAPLDRNKYPVLIKHRKEKSRFLPCFPCIRSTCGRVSCCICILLILIAIILAIVAVTVFKIPTIDYLGPQGNPQFTINQGNVTLGLNMVANIQVVNPNPIGFNFELIAITAYYPKYAPPIGGGKITNVSFPSKSNSTIQFPVVALYSRQEDPGFTVVQSILSKCGILGDTSRKLTIIYDVKISVKILGVKVSPSVRGMEAEFQCPGNIGDIGKGISDLGSWIDKKLFG
ncbi:hypothetical protein BGZ52_010241 [Haplosporangium bisporale]|nr:hypothetical protein BGZ52_010241 [Haplosporangium bisporale]KAF9216762.1 hypothetical protein BGZ59_008147 [Podila verticillata]KAI9231754.1 MAG: hypothetical protein BYD32DRAFT_430045 [Podila humilis]KFH64846.1 hypothetical protein MVEG_09575 [Podila verticillata NRRL 6337]